LQAKAEQGNGKWKQMSWALKKALLMGMFQKMGQAIGRKSLAHMLLTGGLVAYTLFEYSEVHRVVPPFTFLLILIWSLGCFAFKEVSFCW
jgi:hypothetical protein